MEPIREAEMQTQPGKRLNEEPKKSGKGPLLIAGIVLAVLLARLLFRRAPKRLTVALWAVVCFRLLCPVSIDAPVSLVPKAAEHAKPVHWVRI